MCVLWKHYKHLSSNYKYTSTINKKSAKFAYSKRANANIDKCSICLSEFAEGEEGRELVDCKHAFHRDCLEKLLCYAVSTSSPSLRFFLVSTSSR
ncbi:RING-H2 finger protein atl5 [Phtheirospermum japonicum]|uniref:RING-H2 finger protein atl5 n=1 Tax=Phtheirospermum japonicum TaxID=374723 RepID=A0A830BH23_9LAMI|nr:RING-H2 finger protein atl5 [Phtheirospermum japonicum]